MTTTSPADTPPEIWLRTACARNGLSLGDPALQSLERYVSLLRDWNSKVNLISRKDEENLWTFHLLHSLSILIRLEIPHGRKVLDLGTGGGLPGIPLAIVRPDLRFTLLDATRKKVDAVADMVRALALPNVSTAWGRAEELNSNPAHHGAYDIVVCRAVAALKDLVKWSKPFLRAPQQAEVSHTSSRRPVASGLVTLKGGDLDGEIRQARHAKNVREIVTLDLGLADCGPLLASDKKILIVTFDS